VVLAQGCSTVWTHSFIHSKRALVQLQCIIQSFQELPLRGVQDEDQAGIIYTFKGSQMKVVRSGKGSEIKTRHGSILPSESAVGKLASTACVGHRGGVSAIRCWRKLHKMGNSLIQLCIKHPAHKGHQWRLHMQAGAVVGCCAGVHRCPCCCHG
jgi:hypothetical protein